MTRLAEFYVEFERTNVPTNARAVKVMQKKPKSDSHGPIVKFRVSLPDGLFVPQASVEVDIDADQAQAEVIQLPTG